MDVLKVEGEGRELVKNGNIRGDGEDLYQHLIQPFLGHINRASSNEGNCAAKLEGPLM